MNPEMLVQEFNATLDIINWSLHIVNFKFAHRIFFLKCPQYFWNASNLFIAQGVFIQTSKTCWKSQKHLKWLLHFALMMTNNSYFDLVDKHCHVTMCHKIPRDDRNCVQRKLVSDGLLKMRRNVPSLQHARSFN
jgi:hypothetical protein